MEMDERKWKHFFIRAAIFAGVPNPVEALSSRVRPSGFAASRSLGRQLGVHLRHEAATGRPLKNTAYVFDGSDVSAASSRIVKLYIKA